MRFPELGGSFIHSTSAAPVSWLSAVLAVAGLVLLGVLLCWTLSARARVRLQEKELRAAKRELQERSEALVAAAREAARLRRIPKAEILPMLQLVHELRSPLASIQSAVDMLLQGYAATDPELHDEMLTLARERAQAMLARVNDFMRLGAVRRAEIERKVQPVQLLEVVRRLAPEMRVRARWRAVDFRLDLPDSLPMVSATYEDMEHLVSNLANNAIKYTNPGGKVTITLREEEGHIIGAVEDTGIGISPEDMPRIFDDFYRAESAKEMDTHGTGLGLSIAKIVVGLYGGRLDVESEPGRGSKFTFVFPRAEVNGLKAGSRAGNEDRAS